MKDQYKIFMGEFFFPSSMRGVWRSSIILVLLLLVFELSPYFNRELSPLTITLIITTVICAPISFYYQYAMVRSGGLDMELLLPIAFMGRPNLVTLISIISIIGQLLIARLAILVILFAVKSIF